MLTHSSPICSIDVSQNPETLQEFLTRDLSTDSSHVEDPLVSTKFQRLLLLRFDVEPIPLSPLHEREQALGAGTQWMKSRSISSIGMAHIGNNQGQMQKELAELEEELVRPQWHLQSHDTALTEEEWLNHDKIYPPRDWMQFSIDVTGLAPHWQ
jgi:hypothetical protein